MKFSLGEVPARLRDGVQTGDVYGARGPGPRYWIIMSVKQNSCSALGLNDDGEVVSATNYALHVFERRQLLGRCEELEGMKFSVIWYEGAAE